MAAAGQRPDLGRSRNSSSNHHVCVFVYKHDVSYTQADRPTDRPTDRGKRTPSLPLPLKRRDASLERRDPETSHHKDRGGRLRSTRARRRRAPVDGPAGAAPRVHALFERTARRPHIIPQSEPKPSSHSKITLDAKESRKQGSPTKDPAQHRLVDPSTS